MNRLIAVHAPAARCGEIVVISVELWSECVFVHLARGLTDEMQRDWDEWAETAKVARRADEEMPEPPTVRVGEDLDLADDVGTRYARRSGSTGGYPGDPVRAMWRFEPGPPETASRLTLSFGRDTVELEL